MSRFLEMIVMAATLIAIGMLLQRYIDEQREDE